MTALDTYARLECSGVWRRDASAQKQNVIVSFGDATLMLTDIADRPLTHWSLPAVARLNPGELPALYTPDPAGAELLEIDDAEMIAALETIHQTLSRSHGRKGALRWAITGALAIGLGALAVFWLPGALVKQALNSATQSTRTTLDQALIRELALITGPRCSDGAGRQALDRLRARLNVEAPVAILPAELPQALALPGGTIVLSQDMLELTDDPAVAAGHVLSAQAKADENDPLEAFLRAQGISAMMQFLTTGELSRKHLQAQAEAIATTTQPRASSDRLIARFQAVDLPLRPWALQQDITGESVLDLIEADAMQDTHRPALNDSAWVALQSICAN